MRISTERTSLTPFALSLSKGIASLSGEGAGFDWLSPNGSGIGA
jgi:hypothetical protein